MLQKATAVNGGSPTPTPTPSPGPTPTTSGVNPTPPPPTPTPAPDLNTIRTTGSTPTKATTYNGKPVFGNTFGNWGVGNQGVNSGTAWKPYVTPGYKAPQPTVPVSDSNPLPSGIVKSPQFVPQRFGLDAPLGQTSPFATFPQIMNLSPGDIHAVRPNRNLAGSPTYDTDANGRTFRVSDNSSGTKPAKRGYTNAQLVAAANEAVGGAAVPATRGATMNQVAQAAIKRKNIDNDRPVPAPVPMARHQEDPLFGDRFSTSPNGQTATSYVLNGPAVDGSVEQYGPEKQQEANLRNAKSQNVLNYQKARGLHAPYMLQNAQNTLWNPTNSYLNPITVLNPTTVR